MIISSYNYQRVNERRITLSEICGVCVVYEWIQCVCVDPEVDVQAELSVRKTKLTDNKRQRHKQNKKTSEYDHVFHSKKNDRKRERKQKKRIQ